jgi:hypothetical protein
MIKTLLLALTLLLSTIWLQAQDQTPQGQSPQAQPSQTAPQDQTAPTASGQTGSQTSGQTSVEGCLQNASGTYMLTTSSGMAYQLQGKSELLAKHVGHEVRITGTTSASGTSTGSAASDMGGGATAQPTLQVEKLKHISAHCNTSGMGK